MSAEDIEYMDGYKEFPTKESALDWLDNYLSLDERNNLIRALQQPKEKEFAKFNDFYPEDRATYPPTDTEILIKNHNGDNFIAYLDYDDAEDGGWGFYSENGDFIADVNEIDAWMPIPQHERDKNYIPVQERKENNPISNIDDPGTDEEEIWQI